MKINNAIYSRINYSITMSNHRFSQVVRTIYRIFLFILLLIVYCRFPPAHQVLTINQVGLFEGCPANRTTQVSYAPFVQAGFVIEMPADRRSNLLVLLELAQTDRTDLLLHLLGSGLFRRHVLIEKCYVTFLLVKLPGESPVPATFINAVSQPSEADEGNSAHQNQDDPENYVESKQVCLLHCQFYFQVSRVLESDPENQQLLLPVGLGFKREERSHEAGTRLGHPDVLVNAHGVSAIRSGKISIIIP